MKQVKIYADGACSGNPGPGGWGAVLRCENPSGEKEISGSEPHTTNNRMELMAVIEALSCLKEPCKITVVTDSSYVADAFRKRWLDKWQQNGWKTSSKSPVKNTDLWQDLLAKTAPHAIEWQWVKGHAGHPENERADRLAVEAREKLALSGNKGK
jgi:ribonuclease HI